MATTIRPIKPSDRPGWNPLWKGYQAFYECDLSADEDRLWNALLDPGTDGPFGLVAENSDGELVGLAHYLFHITTWSPQSRCYLNDLFIAEDSRGMGVGRKLIEAVANAARAKGAGQLWWLTQEFNLEGRRLYDKVATLTPFVKYARQP